MNSLSAKLLKSMISMLAMALLFIGVTFAWFTVSQQSQTDNISLQVDGDLFEYQFYVYVESLYLGDDAPSLNNKICDELLSINCYEEVETSGPEYLFSDTHTLTPNNRFSFAIKISNISPKELSVFLELKNLSSTGYLLPANKIQVAFEYDVTRIVYVNAGVEGMDIKDSLAIEYAGDSVTPDPHFGLSDSLPYRLASNIPISNEGSSQTIILFFNLYFDPELSGIDEFGLSTGNSNAFQNQSLIIKTLKIDAAEE